MTLLVALTTLTGCAKFDSSKYIESMLDSLYKGQHDAYADITNTSVDQLQINFQDGLNAEIEKLLSYLNISENAANVNEDTRKNARDLFTSLYAAANYTVGQADAQGYVTITIAPINIFALAKEDLTNYVNDFHAGNDAGKFADLTDEEFFSQYVQGVLDILNAKIPELDYGDSQTVTVQVKNTNNIYSITDDEFLSIDRYIIDYSL